MNLSKFLKLLNAYYRFRVFSFISLKAKITGLKSIGKNSDLSPYVVIRGDVEIGSYCSIHEFSLIAGIVTIGNYVRIGSNVTIHSGNHGIDKSELIYTQPSTHKKIIISDDVWIGSGVVILPGVKIHSGAVIGAGAVVTKDIPNYGVAVGNPAKVISFRV